MGPQHPPPHTALNAALRALPRPAPASPASAESSGATGKDGARIRMGTLGGPTLVRASSNRVSYIFTHGSQDASDPRTPWHPVARVHLPPKAASATAPGAACGPAGCSVAPRAWALLLPAQALPPAPAHTPSRAESVV